MKHLYNLTRKACCKSNYFFKGFILLITLSLCWNVSKAQIYLDNFGTNTISGHPYTPVTGTYTADPNLSNFSWSNSFTAWTSFAGASGQALSLNNSTGTPTITLTFDITPGYEATITGFNFWRQRSNTGAQSWAMTINGNAAGSGTVPTSGANIGLTAVGSASNLTGTVTIVLSLSGASGTGTFRLDDFTLNGSVVAGATIAATAPADFGNVCTGTVPGSNTFIVTGTSLTSANVTVGPLAGFTFSTDNATFTPSLTLVQPGGSYSKTIYIRFSPVLLQTYDGDIPVGGGGASSIQVAAIGSGVNTKPSINDGTVSGTTTNAATINATITSTGCTAISGYGIEYSTVPGFADGAGTAVAGGTLSGGNYTTSLPGLAPPGQVFYFHSYATNTGGTAYGNENSFTLLSTTPTLSVPSSGAGSLSSFGPACISSATINSFTLTGSQLNGTDITVGPLANYTFATSLAGTYVNSLTLITGGSGYSYTGGVLSATIYVKFIPAAVQSYNGNIPLAGGGASPINVSAVGSGINTAATVTTSAAIYITTSTATLPGVISSPGCGITLGYGIEYSTAPFAPGAGTQVAGTNLSGSDFSVDLSLLTPGTIYYFYAYVTNAAGTSYGASSNFTTFGLPTKLVITSIAPLSPTALTPFSVTVQAQDNLNNPVDVVSNTDITFNQVAGTGIFTFPNAPLASGTIPAGANTIIISDLSYDIVQNNVGISATASSGMTGLGTSANKIFNVIAYTGPTTFIWSATGGSAWLTGSNWNTGTSPGTSTPGLNQHLASFTSLANLNLTAVGGCGMNMNSVGGAYDVGAVYFAETYNFAHTNNIVPIGNSSTAVSGVLTLWGVPLANAGGITNNNYTSLLIGNYMNTANTTVLEIKNGIGSGNKNLTLNLGSAGSIVAGIGRTINISTLLTGSQPLTFTGGGTFALTPSGAAAVNTFSGTVTIANGTLITGNSGAFGSNVRNKITLGSGTNAGILRLNGNNIILGGLSTAGTAGNANIVDNGNGPAALQIENSTANIFKGSLKDGSAGVLTFVEAGTNSLSLQGLNTMTGVTYVSGGTLILAHPGGGTFPSANSFSANTGGTLQISTDQVMKNLTITVGGTLKVDPGVTLTITGTYTATSGPCTIINNGTIILQGGTAPQSFPGAYTTVSAMKDLTINNAFGVNLDNSLNIGGTLHLITGVFTVGANTLTINNPITGTLSHFAANNTSSVIIAGTAAGVDIPSVVTQLKNLTVSNTVGSTLQGNLNVSTNLFISAGTLYDNQFVLNGTANVTMTGGALNLEQNAAVLPGLTGVYALTAGTVIFDGVGIGTDAQIVRPVNYFNLASASTGDRILSPVDTIGVSNIFTPNLPNNVYTVINSTVNYNKTSAQSVAGFKYYNMTVSGGAVTKTLAGNIDIQGRLSLALNTKFALANFNATLKSDASNTANVAVISTVNSITYGTGRFIVERYIPTGLSHGKSWQLLSVPVSGTQSVKASWQEGNGPLANSTPGFGTTISSERAGATGRGYDFYTPTAPSLKIYDHLTDQWVGVDDGVTNTSSLSIANKKGYMIFVRGDRSVQTSAAPANVTTLRTSGKIYSPGTDAPSSSTVTAGKFETVGNPYASALDFTNLLTTSTGIDSKYYVWDPLLPGTSGWGYGGYQLLSSANFWKPIPGGTANYPSGTAYSKIQSGQAFFVYSTPGGSVNFAESNKSSGSGLVYRPGSNSQRGFLRAWLYGASGFMADGNVVAFDPAFSNSFDANDALKLDNATESFGIKRNANILAFEARNPIIDTDTIFYHISNLNTQAYQLRFAPDNMEGTSITTFFVDKFMGTTTPVSLTDSTFINFNITSDPASKAADRFYIVFKLAGTVPVSFVDISAARKNNGDINVAWTVDNESGIEHYEVERSGNGRDLSSIETMGTPLNNGTVALYNYVDEKSLQGDNFYRIKAVNLSGRIQFSAIVKVPGIKTAPSISIYPNPVTNKTFNVSFINQPAGHYVVQLSNKTGQVVYTGSIDIANGTTIKSCILGDETAAGVYQLRISSRDSKFVQQVLVR